MEKCEELVAETVLKAVIVQELERAVLFEKELKDTIGVDALVELVIANEVWAEVEVGEAVDEGEVAEVDALVKV